MSSFTLPLAHELVDARLVWIIGFVIAMGWLWIAILKGSMYLVED